MSTTTPSLAAETAASAALPLSSRLAGRLADYAELTKARISVMVLVTVGVSGYLARFGQAEFLPLLHAMIGTALVAASASALNQWLERFSDARMPRTSDRPLPAGRLGAAEVLLFSTATFAVGELWLTLACGWLPAAFGLATWVLYVWIYTPLKRRTPWNTAVGAISGAAPVAIGWTAAGGLLDIRLAALFLLVFLWQFPHFMAIAWLYRRQYGDAGMRMMTVCDPSGVRAGVQAVLGASALLPTCAAFGPLFASGAWGLTMVALALLLAAGQLVCAVGFFARRDDRSARRLLRASLIFLPGVLTLLTLVPLV